MENNKVKSLDTQNQRKSALSCLKEDLPRFTNLCGGEDKALKFFGLLRTSLEGRSEKSYWNIRDGLIMLASVGLFPMKGRNVAFLIPYKDKESGEKVLQLQLGYQAFIELAARNGILLNAQVVCEGDQLTYNRGTGDISHFDGPSHSEYDVSKIIGVYATCLWKGQRITESLSKSDIDKHKDLFSKSNSGKFWEKSFSEMAKKTVIIRLCKKLPMLEMPSLQEFINYENETNFDLKKEEPKIVQEKRKALEISVDDSSLEETDMLFDAQRSDYGND